MQITKQKLQALQIKHYSGTSKKTGNEYSFYEGRFLDEAGNVFTFKLKPELFNEKTDLNSFINKPINCDIDLYYSTSRGICGELVALTK